MAKKWTKEDLIQIFETLIKCKSDLISHPEFRSLLDRNRNLFANQITREANGNIAYDSVDFELDEITADEEFWNRIDSTPYNDLIEDNAAVAILKMAEKFNLVN